ncbi:MAG TPA: nitrate- and nitrite sensing domain-containing protein, partial [Telluria sp.]|nr:nitrate- and nitrite sensing domain-containing protein [Telluria sp.]
MRSSGQALEALMKESQARQPMAVVLKAIQNTQQHRGQSALVLGGAAEASGKRAAKQEEVDGLFKVVDDTVRTVGDTEITLAWDEAKRDWDTLRQRLATRSLSVPDSFAAHSALIARLLIVSELLADHFGLNLDTDLDTYQLVQATFYHLPYLTEESGKMRAKGAGLLAAKQASAEDRLALSAIVARVADRLKQTTRQFDKASRANPEIKAKLDGAMAHMGEQAQQAMRLATEQIVKPEALAYSGPEYVRLATVAIDAQYAFAAAASGEFDQLLDHKIAALHQQR